jgi:hypothetical protein
MSVIVRTNKITKRPVRTLLLYRFLGWLLQRSLLILLRLFIIAAILVISRRTTSSAIFLVASLSLIVIFTIVGATFITINITVSPVTWAVLKVGVVILNEFFLFTFGNEQGLVFDTLLIEYLREAVLGKIVNSAICSLNKLETESCQPMKPKENRKNQTKKKAKKKHHAACSMQHSLNPRTCLSRSNNSFLISWSTNAALSAFLSRIFSRLSTF